MQALRGETLHVVVFGGSMTAGHMCGHPYAGEEAEAASLHGRPPERNGGCWHHCSPGHASFCSW